MAIIFNDDDHTYLYGYAYTCIHLFFLYFKRQRNINLLVNYYIILINIDC